MAEGGDTDAMPASNAQSGPSSTFNMRVGQSTGTTRLTDTSNNTSNQSCQC